MIIREAATIGNKTLFTCYSEWCDDPRKECDPFGSMVCWHRRYDLGDNHHYDDPEDFLTNMVIEHCDPASIFRFVKSGNCKEARLTYNRSAKEWALESLWNGEWYQEDSYAPGLSAKNLPTYFIDKVVELLTVGEKHTLLDGVKGLVILPLFLYDHSGLSMNASGFSCPWDSGQVGWIYATPADIADEYGNITDETIERARLLLLSGVETYDCYLRGECYGFATYEGKNEVDSCGGYLGDYDGFTEGLAHELAEEWRPLIDALTHCSANDVPSYFWSLEVSA